MTERRRLREREDYEIGITCPICAEAWGICEHVRLVDDTLHPEDRALLTRGFLLALSGATHYDTADLEGDVMFVAVLRRIGYQWDLEIRQAWVNEDDGGNGGGGQRK